MPVSASDYLGVSEDDFSRTGAFNVVVDLDTRLFIDPSLLRVTSVPEFAESYAKLRRRFADVLLLLRRSQVEGDLFWRNAEHQFNFPEVEGTCIGYAKTSTSGSGMGRGLQREILRTAKTIIDAGTEEPELFELLALFEKGVGADRISDMTARIIYDNLLSFSERVFVELGVETASLEYGGRPYSTVINSFNELPLVLVPKELLRTLPLATCWSDVDYVCSENEELRRRLNFDIGETWRSLSARVPKSRIKELLLENPELLQDLIDTYRSKEPTPYDFGEDPSGEAGWYLAAKEAVVQVPLELELPANPRAEQVFSVVGSICQNFKELVEANGLSKLLYRKDGKPKHESASQLLFFGIADAYCRANNLDLSPESDSGRGPVDFKVSSGYAARTIVEVKLSKNSKLLQGFERQVRAYERAERATHVVYLVIMVHARADQALERLYGLKNSLSTQGRRTPEIRVVDGRVKASASKL